MINNLLFSHQNIRVSFTYLIFVVLVSQLFSCQKKEENLLGTPLELEESLFNLEWATRMDSEKEIVNLAHGVSYENWYIRSGDKDDPSKIMAFHKDTGLKEWEIVFDELDGYNINSMHLHEHILVSTNAYYVFAFDLESKQIVWKENLKAKGMLLGKGTIAANEKFYLNATFNFDPLGGGVAHLYEFDIYTGIHRTVYSKAPDSLRTGTMTISLPVYWKNEIILFNAFPNSERPPEEVQQYIMAYDMTAQKIIWKTQVVHQYGSNKLITPIIHKNSIITGGGSDIYGFDLNTGTHLWTFKMDYPWSIWNDTNHLIHEGRLYLNNGQHDVTCIHPETGKLIWNNPHGGANCTQNMTYYEKENLLVFASWGYGSVMILDALTGKTIHREHRFDNSQYFNDILYDEDRDMFFTSTYKHAIGFKINTIR
ncbi:MAG: PQQ-binding-like beta-propeller repeat protein [Saprospiraceae bacterium]|nr:PQQ-binding-like beta-propeller repeat protein [Saprospiraceae bacterium]